MEESDMKVQPYLFFNGRCEEAIDFYMLMRFSDAPEPPPADKMPPGSGNKVMHACLRIGETEVMASDGMCSGKAAFEGVSLSLQVPNEAEADRLFNALGEGGQVQMPIGKTFFSPRFGVVADRFGVSWMVVTTPAAAIAAAA
jgi:PhnB protein